MTTWIEIALCIVPAVFIGTTLFIACRNVERFQAERAA